MNIRIDDVNKIRLFNSHYKVAQIIDCSTYKRKSFLGEKVDNCRFCGVTKKAGNFRKDAHVIPAFLGSRFLLSYYECDDCNSHFQKFEDTMANFLGLYRTATSTKGRSIPKFKDTSTGVEAHVEPDGMVNFIIPQLNELEDEINQGKVTVTAKNNPYVPLLLYKLLVKIALAIAPTNKMLSLGNTSKFLLDKLKLENPDKIDFFKCCFHFIPGPTIVENPMAVLYERINSDSYIPELLFQLLYKNISFQIFIPFNEQDSHLNKPNTTLTIPFNPMLISVEHEEEFGPKQFSVMNLNSSVKTIANDISLTFKFITLERNKNGI